MNIGFTIFCVASGLIAVIALASGIIEAFILPYYTYRKRPYDNPKYNFAKDALHLLPGCAIIDKDLDNGWYKVEIEGRKFIFNLDTKQITPII